MSVYLDETKEAFIPFFGSSIISTIKNKDDMLPLMNFLNKETKVKCVYNLHYKVFDIYSQTLAAFGGDNCAVIEKWAADNKFKINPHQFLDYNACLETHYEAKSLIQQYFPLDFEISGNLRVRMMNDKIVIKFDFVKNHGESVKSLVTDLNKLYGTKRNYTKYITIGYVKDTSLELKRNYIEILNSLIPQKIYVNSPNIYHYNNIDNYRLYSEGLY